MTTTAPALSFEADGELARRPALDELRVTLETMLEARFPPSLCLAVVTPKRCPLIAAGGAANLVGEVVRATERTRYDLASLTKVICTIPLVLIARQRGVLSLDDHVQRFLPRYPTATTTLAELATHTAGLIDHRPFFATASGRKAVEDAVYVEARGAVAGDTVCYSDLGYMLLGWVLEACFAAPLERLFAEELAAPLGLEHAGFRPDAPRSEIAATELDGDQRLEPELVWGEVHDGNAYALGGVSGHAGLFARLADLVRFCQLLLAPGPDTVLNPGSVELLGLRRAATGQDVRGLGWRLEPTEWGDWPPGTIWHTGFTGTSLLVAPASGVAVVLLTNGVHPVRRLDEQASMRATIHRLIAEATR